MTTSDRPTPPPELSLKFMAWDVKKIGEKLDYLKEIAMQLTVLNVNLSKLIQGGPNPAKIAKLAPGVPDEAPPF